jgi:hypothetical protein
MNRVLKTLLVCSVAGLLLGTRTRLFAEQDDSLVTLRAAKLKAAQQWWEVLAIKIQTARLSPADAAVLKAAQALRDAQIETATSKDERIKALETYRDHMRDMLEAVKARVPVQAGDDDVAEARIHLLDAKIAFKLETVKP